MSTPCTGTPEGFQKAVNRHTAWRTLIRAIVDLGSQDIYTDAPEYRDRVESMRKLTALMGQHLDRKVITTDMVADALPNNTEFLDRVIKFLEEQR